MKAASGFFDRPRMRSPWAMRSPTVRAVTKIPSLPATTSSGRAGGPRVVGGVGPIHNPFEPQQVCDAIGVGVDDADFALPLPGGFGGYRWYPGEGSLGVERATLGLDSPKLERARLPEMTSRLFGSVTCNERPRPGNRRGRRSGTGSRRCAGRPLGRHGPRDRSPS